MKIALIYLGRRGGGNIYSLEIAKFLSKKVEVLAIISKQSQNIEYWDELNIQTLKIDTYDSVHSFISSTLNMKKFLLIRKRIQYFKPDVIYYPMLHPWAPIINFMNKRIPIVTTIHDPVLHKGEKNFILYLIQNLSMKQSSRVIFLSKFFLSKINKKLRKKVDIIPHGEFSFYKQKTDRIENGKNKNVLLFFGRIEKYKGLDVLLSAFPIIKQAIPDVKLIIAGSGDIKPYYDKIRNLNGVELFNRWIDDSEVVNFFSKATVVVIPYIDASQSGIIPLAFSLKVPVIATNVGGLSEQIKNNEDGILVESKNPYQLAEACIQILKDEKLANQLAENAFKKSLNEWNWCKISNLLVDVFNKSVARFN